MTPNHWFARMLRRPSLRRSPASSVQPRLTALEDRLAPATLDLLAGGTLVYTGANVANALAFSLAGGTYTFNDPLDPITLGPGAIGAGYSTTGDTASGPSAGVAGIAINLGSAANTLNLGTFDAAVPALSVTSAGIAGSTAGVSGPLTSTGAVGFGGFEAITLAGAVTATGDVTIRSDGLDIQQPLSAGANRVTIAPTTLGRAVNLGGPDSTTELGLTDAELDFVTAGNVSIGAAGTGSISVSSAISQAGSGYTLLALTSDGAIAGTGGSIAVDNLALQSATGIALITQASNLSFVNLVSGAVTIANTGGLALQPVAGLGNSANAGSTIDIATSGALLVAENIDSPGSITLTTIDAAGAGQGLLVNAGVTVHSSGGDVVLRAGDDLGLSAGSLIQAAGTVGLVVDFGDADPGVGGIASVPGATLSAQTATLTGGPDDDIFNLSASAATPIAVNGGAGSNTLNFDALGNPVTIDPTAITVTGAQPVTYTSIAAIVLSNATTVAMNGTTGDDAFTLVRTASGTVATINGGPGIVVGELPLTVNGLSGTNSLLLDFSGGSPIPAGGLALLNINQYQIEGTAGNDTVDLQRAGGVTQFRLNGGAFFDLPGVTAFRFDGLAGADTMHVLYAGGDPVPVGGVTFDGGPGSDALGVFGAGNIATYRPSATTPGDGTVTVDAGTIAFANLTPVDITGMTTAMVILPGADEVLAVDNGFDFTSGGATPALRVSGMSGGVPIEIAALWNNTTVVIDTRAIDGNDTIAVNSATVGNNTNLTVATGVGTDTVAVGAGGILLAGQLSVATQTITVSGPITSTGASGGITFTNAGTLAIGDVAISSQGPIVQNGAGPVAITGNASFTTNTGAISIQGPVALAAGVTASFVSTGNAPISFGGTLDGGGFVTVTTGGLTTFAGAIGGGVALGSLATNGGGVTAINGSLVLTTGAQSYADAVTLGAGTTQFVSTGNAPIAFAGTLSGGSAVTVTTGGLTTFGGAVTLASLTTDGGGTTAVNGGSVQTTGFQLYGDNVAVGAAATTFVSTGNAFISFAGSLDGASDVTITTAGATTLAGAVGGTTALNSLTLNGGGTTNINGGLVRTTGAQQYSDAIFLGGAATQFNSAGNAPITFGGTLDGASAVIVTTGGLTTFTGAVGGATALTSLTTDGGGLTAINGGLVSTTGLQQYSDIVTVAAAATLFISSGNGAITFGGTLDGASAVTITTGGLTTFTGLVGSTTPLTSVMTAGGGTTAINGGLIRTSGAQEFDDAVILGAGATQFLSTGNGPITFRSTLDGASAVMVTTAGLTNFVGAVGGGAALASLSTNGGGTTAVNGGLIRTTGAQQFSDAVTVGTAAATLFTSTGNAAITFGSTLDGASAVTVTTGGATTFAGPVGAAIALTSLTTNGGGTTAVNGGLVRTTGAQLYSDAVTVGAVATQFVSIGGGAITFSSTLNGASAVTVTSGGLIAFFGAVGGLIPLTSLSTGGGGTTDLNAGTVTTGGDQIYNAPVILTANTVLNAVNVTFAQTLNSDGTARSLLVNASGVTTFGGAVGGTQRLASLTTDAPGATRINGGLVNTVGSQIYGDAVTLSAGSAVATTTTLIATAAAPGGITFANSINGASPRNQVLQLLANAGDVNFVGPVGGVVELGQVTVSNAHNVTVGASFIASQFLQTTGTGTTAFNGAIALSAVGAVDVTNQVITLSQPIIAGANGASVRLNATAGGVTQTGGVILAGAGTTAAGRDGALVLNGAGVFTLDQPGNDVAYFAAFVTGPVTYRDANDLTIIPGGGVHTNGGAITLTTGRNFTAIDTNFAVPLLDAGAGVIQVNPGQSAGAVITLNAEVRGSVVTFGTDLGAPRSNALPDLFVIRPSRNITITVKGNRPSPTLADPIPPGDRLQPIFAGINGRLVLTPTGLGQGFYTFPDDTVRPLTFFEIENLVGFSVSAYSVQTGPTSYGIRTINQQLGQTIQGGISGGQVPSNPFVVAPAIVNPFGPFGAPRIVFGDVNGDGTADLIVGNGPNNPPLVTVINGTALLGVNNVSLSDPANVLAQFFAYDPQFPGGVFVAAGDFNGDGRAEIVTGPDVGGGPHVRVLQFVRAGDPDFVPGVTNIYYNVRNFSSDLVSLPANFNAYDPNFHGGVRVAVGDVDGDGRPDIVTGPGIGGGPHVKVFSGASGAVIRSFLAYAPNFLGGIYVAAGDYNQDGKADILTGAGVGGAPHVEVFSGATLAPTLLASFLAFPPSPPSIIPDPNANTGVGSVAFTDANGDGQLDILVGTARGPQARALVFRGPGFTPILSPQDELLISPTLHDGANVAGNAFVITGP